MRVVFIINFAKYESSFLMSYYILEINFTKCEKMRVVFIILLNYYILEINLTKLSIFYHIKISFLMSYYILEITLTKHDKIVLTHLKLISYELSYTGSVKKLRVDFITFNADFL